MTGVRNNNVMTIQQLKYTITIANQGSFNKASEVLYISQPSLTESIKELEKELNITIFYRSGKGVTLTNEGVEFLAYARELYGQFENVLERYGENESRKKIFSVSTQHYTFAVKSFVELVKKLDTSEFEFAIREEQTQKIIDDVINMNSEIGILYLSSFNMPVIGKLLRQNHLEFHELISCEAYVYLWKGHPLADNERISFDELKDYPCLSFEQGGNGSMYFAEEILASYPYPRIIRATDRATMLNLMVGLGGYTLCSGIICEELNGSDFIAVPFAPDDAHPGETMKVGYITKKNLLLSKVGKIYIEELKRTLSSGKADGLF